MLARIKKTKKAATGEPWALNTLILKSTVEVEEEGSAHSVWHCSHQGGSAHPALVPPVCRPAGNETQVHVDHLPVDWIRRRAGPDQGEDAPPQGHSLSIQTLFPFFLKIPAALQFLRVLDGTLHASQQRAWELSVSENRCLRPLPILCLLSFHVGNLISHIFWKNEICCEADWERYFSYSSVEVPDSYSGPRPTFPLTLCGLLKLVEAFRHKQVK